MIRQYEGWVVLLLVLGVLLWVQRSLHREIQRALYLLFRREEVSLVLFSLLFLPGVFLHEASHFIAARCLRVRTGRFSVIPKPLSNGRLRMGFVETAPGGVVRDSLVGLAPLLAGGGLVAWIGLSKMQLQWVADSLMVGQFASFWQELPDRAGSLLGQTDFWLWFYLVFVISSTMFPSPSDRRAWVPLIIAVGLLLGLAVLLGAGAWISSTLAPSINLGLHLAASVFAISLAVHAVLLVPIWGIRALICHAKGHLN